MNTIWDAVCVESDVTKLYEADYKSHVIIRLHAFGYDSIEEAKEAVTNKVNKPTKGVLVSSVNIIQVEQYG